MGKGSSRWVRAKRRPLRRPGSEPVRQAQADGEEFDIGRLDPVHHGFAEIASQVGDVVAQLPVAAAVLEAAEVGPARQQAEGQGARECIIQSGQHLVAEQHVSQCVSRDGFRPGQVVAQPLRSLVRQSAFPGLFGRFDGRRIAAPPPQGAMIQGGPPHARTDTDVGSEAACVRKIEIGVGKERVRDQVTQVLFGAWQFRAEQIGIGLAGRRNDGRGPVKVRFPVEILQFDAQALPELPSDRNACKNAGGAVETTRPRVDRTNIPVGGRAVLNLRVLWIDKPVAVGRPVIVPGTQFDVLGKVGTKLTSQVKTGIRVDRRP